MKTEFDQTWKSWQVITMIKLNKSHDDDQGHHRPDGGHVQETVESVDEEVGQEKIVVVVGPEVAVVDPEIAIDRGIVNARLKKLQ